MLKIEDREDHMIVDMEDGIVVGGVIYSMGNIYGVRYGWPRQFLMPDSELYGGKYMTNCSLYTGIYSDRVLLYKNCRYVMRCIEARLITDWDMSVIDARYIEEFNSLDKVEVGDKKKRGASRPLHMYNGLPEGSNSKCDVFYLMYSNIADGIIISTDKEFKDVVDIWSV